MATENFLALKSLCDAFNAKGDNISAEERASYLVSEKSLYETLPPEEQYQWHLEQAVDNMGSTIEKKDAEIEEACGSSDVKDKLTWITAYLQEMKTIMGDINVINNTLMTELGRVENSLNNIGTAVASTDARLTRLEKVADFNRNPVYPKTVGSTRELN